MIIKEYTYIHIYPSSLQNFMFLYFFSIGMETFATCFDFFYKGLPQCNLEFQYFYWKYDLKTEQVKNT